MWWLLDAALLTTHDCLPFVLRRIMCRDIETIIEKMFVAVILRSCHMLWTGWPDSQCRKLCAWRMDKWTLHLCWARGSSAIDFFLCWRDWPSPIRWPMYVAMVLRCHHKRPCALRCSMSALVESIDDTQISRLCRNMNLMWTVGACWCEVNCALMGTFSAVQNLGKHGVNKCCLCH